MGDPAGPAEAKPPPRPLWVKLFAILAAVAVVLVVIVALLSRGEHGPGRHMRGDETGDHTPPVQHSP